MYKIKRKMHKDRYGIVRGSVIMYLLIALLIGIFSSIELSDHVSSEKKHAEVYAQQVAATFDSLIDQRQRLLQSYVNMLDQGDVLADSALKGLTAIGSFETAQVQQNIDDDQSLTIRQDGACLRFSSPLANGDQLVASFDAASLNAVLSLAVPDGYGYLIYNSRNGDLLINSSEFEVEGYYDLLMSLNQNGSMEELLDSAEGAALVPESQFRLADGYYISQCETATAPWSIALVIPEGLMHGEGWSGRGMVAYAAVTVVLILVCFIVNTCAVLRRIHLANQNTTRALGVSERMTNVIAQDAQITTFVYYRPKDSILAWYDGCDLIQNDADPARRNNLSALTEMCRLVDGESDRIYNALFELREKRNIEIELRGFSDVHDDCTWRLTMHALDSNSGMVFCTLQDRTQMLFAQDRATQEQEYRASVEKKVSSIWTICVSKNLWTSEYTRGDRKFKSLNMRKGSWNDYAGDLRSHMREYIHPADYDLFTENVAPSELMDDFRSGKTEFTLEYRIRSNENGAYEWHRVCMRLWQDVQNGNVMASAYVFNVDAKKNAELERGERKKMLQQTLTALGGVYNGLYYVDLDSNLAYTARSLGGDVVDRLCMPYQEWIEKYIADSVHPEDQPSLKQLLSSYMIRRSLTEGAHMHPRIYKRRVNDDVYDEAELILQPARFENGVVKEVIIAIRYIDHD